MSPIVIIIDSIIFELLEIISLNNLLDFYKYFIIFSLSLRVRQHLKQRNEAEPILKDDYSIPIFAKI